MTILLIYTIDLCELKSQVNFNSISSQNQFPQVSMFSNFCRPPSTFLGVYLGYALFKSHEPQISKTEMTIPKKNSFIEKKLLKNLHYLF